MTHTTARTGSRVLGQFIDALSHKQAMSLIMEWARRRQPRAAYFCNVHSVVTASKDAAYAAVLSRADYAAPDGAPVAWRLRRKGYRQQVRVSGPDLMESLLDAAATEGMSVYFYGGEQDTLQRLKDKVEQRLPSLKVAGIDSPPFRALTAEEDEAAVARIRDSGAQLVFVGLGCPRQEQWIDAHRDRIAAPLLGVGAAFAFHAGVLTRGPKWMQTHGLEWLYRLASEPRRLFRRYMVTNTAFILHVSWEMLCSIGRGHATAVTQAVHRDPASGVSAWPAPLRADPDTVQQQVS